MTLTKWDYIAHYSQQRRWLADLWAYALPSVLYNECEHWHR